MAESPKAHPWTPAERAAVYRAIHERRDVRRGFLPEPLPANVLHRLLAAAHAGPSVGLMQPARFLLVREVALRQAIHAAFSAANAEAAARYSGSQREQYDGLKLEGLLQAPQHLCVLCDEHSSQGSGLGRQTMPETAAYSAVCAVQNLWLAARAEGVGVGWVSILDPARLRTALGIPAHLRLVAYLCLGWVEAFADRPDLEAAGWERRRELPEFVAEDGCPPHW